MKLLWVSLLGSWSIPCGCHKIPPSIADSNLQSTCLINKWYEGIPYRHRKNSSNGLSNRTWRLVSMLLTVHEQQLPVTFGSADLMEQVTSLSDQNSVFQDKGANSRRRQVRWMPSWIISCPGRFHDHNLDILIGFLEPCPVSSSYWKCPFSKHSKC